MRTRRRGLAVPAFNERASELANEVDADPGTWVNESETNEGGEFTGYEPDVTELYEAVEAVSSMITWGIGNVPQAGTVARFPAPWFASGNVGTDEDEVQFVVPFDCVIDELLAEWEPTSGSVNVDLTVRKDGVPTPLTVTVLSDDGVGEDLVNFTQFTRGERISLVVAKSASTGSVMGNFRASVRVRAIAS